MAKPSNPISRYTYVVHELVRNCKSRSASCTASQKLNPMLRFANQHRKFINPRRAHYQEAIATGPCTNKAWAGQLVKLHA